MCMCMCTYMSVCVTVCMGVWVIRLVYKVVNDAFH